MMIALLTESAQPDCSGLVHLKTQPEGRDTHPTQLPDNLPAGHGGHVSAAHPRGLASSSQPQPIGALQRRHTPPSPAGRRAAAPGPRAARGFAAGTAPTCRCSSLSPFTVSSTASPAKPRRSKAWRCLAPRSAEHRAALPSTAAAMVAPGRSRRAGAALSRGEPRPAQRAGRGRRGRQRAAPGRWSSCTALPEGRTANACVFLTRLIKNT